MKWLEVRRHSLTKKGAERGRGSHLSAAGVALARAVGTCTGPFDYVLASSSPRAVETAIAMGCAVDDTVDLPGGYVSGVVEHHDQWSWDLPYGTYAEKLAASDELTAAAATERDSWLRALAQIGEGSTTLVVSHGGSIEPALVTCLPDADHRSWGRPFAHCDGVRLTYADVGFTGAEFLRAPPTRELDPHLR